MFLTTYRGSALPQTKDFDKLFDDLWNSSFSSFKSDKYPATNIYSEDDVTHIEIAVTGFSKDDLDITIDKDTLTVSATRSEEDNAEREYFHKGIAKRSFTRSFQLAENIEDVKANVENGILQLKLVRATPVDTSKKILIS